MKLWTRIELILNKIIVTIMSTISSTIKNLIPTKVKKTIESTKTSSLKITIQTKETIFAKAKSSKKWGINKAVQSKAAIENVKGKTKETVHKARTFNWKELNLKIFLVMLTALILPLTSKLKLWALSLNPTTILVTSFGSIIISLCTITVVQQGQEISEKTKSQVREPSSYTDSVDKNSYARSKYRHHKDLVVTLTAVSIPIYIESRKGMQSLLIDFTLEAENRYIAKYFKLIKNEYILRDRLNKNIQPIIPSFPMQPEGKIILKNKIKSELNALISNLKIKGKVKNIYIHSILTD